MFIQSSITYAKETQQMTASLNDIQQCKQSVYNVTPRRDHCSRGKAISITHYECVYVALVIQHTERMRLVMSSVACPALPYFFPNYLVNGSTFDKTLLNMKCVFWFLYNFLSETFLILRRIRRDIFINVHLVSCKVPAILVRLECTSFVRKDLRLI
jgi:hypothetical protein